MIRDRWSAPASWYAGALMFLCLLCAGAARATPAAGDPESAYAEELVERAQAAQLYLDPFWRTLVHYKRGLFGDRSLVDDPAFFADPNGKQDPQAELVATLRAFFGPEPEEGKHPVCRWAARFDWLKSELEIDESRLPVPVCAPVEALLDQIQPKTITLAFPTSHINSPASMYGHTLLIIDNVYDSELLSFAVNYAGVTDTTFGPIYAVKGIFGLYRGYYSILPYYAKLQEYNDVNDRDIWEYTLNLDEQEIRRLVLHVYELEGVYSDYYFFDENCSYNLLFLLDAARPGLDLTDHTGLWVIPLDTIREVRKSGLIASVEYRPSKSTKIHHIASQLSDEDQKLALAIARGQQEPVAALQAAADSSRTILVCDLASEYLQYEYFERKLPQEEYAPRLRSLLAVRSGLGSAAPGVLEPPRPPRPDNGHRSARIGVGGGALDGAGFAQLRLRPVYHDVLDNAGGYKEGSEIVFGELELRYYAQSEDLELERLRMIRIMSLAPRDRFTKSTSWKVDTGFMRRVIADGKRALVYEYNQGYGYTFRNRVTGLWYLIAEGDAQVGGSLHHNYSIGFGGSTGILKRLTRRWQAHLYARDVYFAFGEGNDVFRASLAQNLELAPDWAVRGECSRVSEQDLWWWEWSLRLNLYF